MKKRPIADHRSWRFQVAIHDYVRRSDPLASSTDVLPSAADRERFWSQCQHFSWFFLPWHRMYLHHFEQIVAAEVLALGGPADWALPYWNYSTDTASRRLPPPFLGPELPWWAAGLPVAWVRSLSWTHTHHAAAVAFALAALWCLSRPHARALIVCHAQRPLAPSGWPATRDTFATGVRLGGACIVSCWPLMVACTLTGHSITAMLGGGAISALERLSFRPPIRRLALLTLGLSGWHVALVLVSHSR